MRVFCLLVAALIVASAAPVAAAAECGSLSGKSIGGALVVETNEITPPFIATSMSPRGVTVTSPFCRVRGLIRPTADSNIYFEVWLPSPDKWNGRYEGNTPGGYAGSMFYQPMVRALAAGYAASSTDNGHLGSDAAEWAIGHPEKVADWGWRAAHVTAVASKAIIAAYYGSPPKYSYYIGCSKGGGSGLMEAERFPNDYNGVIAGAPGWDHSGQLTKYLWTIQTVQMPGAWLSPAKLALLHQAVLQACRGHDGILDDPGSCQFDPARLRCKKTDADTCLTAQQVTSVRRIYSGPTDVSGRSIYPGYARGSELNWSRAMMGSEDQPAIGTASYNSFTGMVRDLLFENAHWGLQALVPAEVYRQAQQKLGPAWDAVNTDLSAFKAAGGKMITYQGWTDDSVPPEGTIRFYQLVAQQMGGVESTQSFYRLFLAPGMDHCFGGTGPSAIGGAYDQAPPVRDAQHDVVDALARWVEQGVAPDQLVATRYRDNLPMEGIAAQRPWCPYPATARYTGRGDRSEAGSWSCSVTTKKK